MIDEIFGYKFKNKSLLKAALTHPSARKKYNYQTLEFLGDRILDLVIAEYLLQKYPNEVEGDLAKRLIAFVCGTTLAKIAKEYNIGKEIIISYGEEHCGGRENHSTLEDIMEAILAAIYLDCKDLEKVRKIILRLWDKYFGQITKPPQDPKSELQEIMQKQHLDLPLYEVVEVTGPAHEPIFTMKLTISGYKAITLQAENKKKAESQLAKLMLEQISNE
jgi:ribonuclease-3